MNFSVSKHVNQMSRDQLLYKSRRSKKQSETWKSKDTLNDEVVGDVPGTSKQKEKIYGVSTVNGSYPSKGVNIAIVDDTDMNDGLPENFAEDNIIIESDDSSTEDCILEEVKNNDYLVFDRVRRPAFRLTKCRKHYKKDRSNRPISRTRHVYLVSSSDSDSDCEVLENSLGIRAEWEKASLRKQKSKVTRNPQFDIEDQVSVSGSNSVPKAFSCETSWRSVELENFDAHNFNDIDFAEVPNRSNSDDAIHNDERDNMSSCSATSDGVIEECHPKSAESEVSVSSTCKLSGSAVQGSCSNKVDAGKVNHELVKERDNEEETLCSIHMQDLPFAKIASIDFENDVGSLGIEDELLGAREKLKETADYKLADQEEWASRYRELQLQAEETQRLRKRKKAETRLLDMERRMKQRLDEVRETLKKDEETMNLKEKYRVEVRKKLDQYEIMYRDMASLLRGLGIQVGGNPCPMPGEVNAAYKRALVKFHPDHASRGDIRQQIEAEETFKMISQLKDKLPLTLNYLFPTSLSRW